MRALTVGATTAALLAVGATAASAHAELVPYQLPPGATGELSLMITHGCADDEEWISTEPQADPPTTAVTLQVPLELQVVPHEVEGWTLTTQTDGGDRVTAARWDADDPAGTTETVAFPFDATVAEVPDGTQIWLPIVQECVDGETLEWTEQGDLRGGDAIPAMRLIVNDDAAVPAPRDQGEGTSTDVSTGEPPSTVAVGGLGPASLAVGLVGVVGIGVALWRRRRPID